MRANAARAISEAFRFVVWAQSLRRQPTIEEIMAHWECSRASAYRYRNAVMDAMGQYYERGPCGVSNDHRTGRAAEGSRTVLRRKLAA